MPDILVGDRCFETTQTEGLGSYTLLGNLIGYQRFASVFFGLTDTGLVYYTCDDGIDFEVGWGTLTAGPPDVLARDHIVSSSNGGSPVAWGPGTRNIYLTPSAAFLVLRDTTGAIQCTDGAATVAEANHLDSGAPGQIWHSGRAPSLIATNGYQVVPSGKIEQWGVVVAIAADSAITVNFPMAFPTAVFGVTVTPKFLAGDPNTVNTGIVSASATLTQLTINNGISQIRDFFWQAIGH